MDTKITSFELITGSNEQINHLYDLLKKRTFTISHKHLPSYNNHKNFVLEHPYRYWYLISFKKSYIGSFYLKKDNSVGININFNNKEILISILNFLKLNHSPNNSYPSLVPPYFYLNVASDNTQFQGLLKDLDLFPIQISYKI